MAARSTGRRRPAGRRGGVLGGARRAGSGVDGRIRLLRFVFIVFLVLVGLGIAFATGYRPALLPTDLAMVIALGVLIASKVAVALAQSAATLAARG